MSSPLLSFPIGLLVFFPMSYTQNMYLYTNLPQPTRFDQRWKPTVAETAPNCPRCDSPNTKFCYYNNYSLTQPRYFCKACRRYWTKGGSLRNVPVGGACRKSRKRHAKPSRYVPNYSDKPNSSRSLRPDLALNGMVVSGPSINGSSNGTSDCIDLEVLYSKYLKPGQATAVVGDQGLGSGLDESEEDPTAFGLQVSDSPNFSGTVDAKLAWQHEQLQQEEMDTVDCMLGDMQHQDLMGVDWMSFGAS